VTGLGLALLDVHGLEQVRGWVTRDHQLLARSPALTHALEREDDGPTLVATWARAAVQDSLDLSRLSELGEEQAAQEAAEVVERLDRVRARGANLATHRPWRSDPWLALGAAEFLGTWRTQGSSAATRETWRPLLERAEAHAGADHLPKRLLALAWLNDWRKLEEHERAPALEAIGSALADPATFHAVLPGWLAANARGQTELALGILPDRTATWEAVAAWWLSRGQPGRAIDAWIRRDGARAAEARAALERAEAMIRGGAARRARGELHAVLALPPRRDHAQLFVEAARRMPGGPADPGLVPQLERWLEWAVELAVHGRPALPDDVLQRLGAAVDPTLGAAANAIGGDLDRAQSLMRRTDIHQSPRAWRELLFLALAHEWIARGDGVAALTQLEQLPRERRTTPEALRLEHAAASRIAGSARVRTPTPSTWRVRDRRMTLDLEVPSEAVLELALQARAGTVLEVSVDGHPRYVLVPRTRTLELELPPEGGPVLIAIEALRGSAQPPLYTVRLPK
jgi:hypothetical protein